MDGRKLARELFGLFLLFWALLVLLSLVTFDVNDPSLNHVASGTPVVRNKAGLFGAYLAGFLNDIMGIASYIWPLVFGALGAAYISTVYELVWWRWCGYFLLTLCLLSAGAAFDFSLGDIRGGGMVGRGLYANTRLYFSPGGAGLLWFFTLIFAAQLAFGVSWWSLCKRAGAALQKLLRIEKLPASMFTRPAWLPSHLPSWEQIRARFLPPPTSNEPMPEVMEESLPADVTLAHEDTASPPTQAHTQPPAQADKPTPALHSDMSRPIRAKVPLPSLDILSQESAGTNKAALEDIDKRGTAVMACLADFGVKGELVRVTPGPVVTMFEVRPAAGVHVNRIANLSDNLALTLKAMAVRIQAPIPGSDTVGIEIPNERRAEVNFRALLETDAFRKSAGPLSMALGRDIAGRPLVADLSRMPHLLVAGATGAGKSVCLNSILLSFLYTVRPDQVQMLLIDPKRIEMAAYANLPHLVHPVVTEMHLAKTALDWAVNEMDQRWKALGRLGVRGLAAYNQKLASYKGDLPPELADLEHLPYLVIIIDELADLMLTAAREVETSIVRLAQLARAAGIHMILATQRPSVDVVTGLIKANFPCRISFQVTSKHDSRTILDTVGAEHLLGKGDMLYKPSGGRLQRLHGPFVSDEEVQRVVAYWKHQMPPAYRVDFGSWGMETAAGGALGGADASSDALYGEVQAFVMEQGKASISLVQRRFKIGFNRAARLLEQLERDGVIGPADGVKPRPVAR